MKINKLANKQIIEIILYVPDCIVHFCKNEIT